MGTELEKQQNRGVLEKLLVCQLLKKFPAFCVTRRLITVFTRFPYSTVRQINPKTHPVCILKHDLSNVDFIVIQSPTAICPK